MQLTVTGEYLLGFQSPCKFKVQSFPVLPVKGGNVFRWNIADLTFCPLKCAPRHGASRGPLARPGVCMNSYNDFGSFLDSPASGILSFPLHRAVLVAQEKLPFIPLESETNYDESCWLQSPHGFHRGAVRRYRYCINTRIEIAGCPPPQKKVKIK